MVQTGKLQCGGAWCLTVSNCCWHSGGLFWPRPVLGTAEANALGILPLRFTQQLGFRRILKKKKGRKCIQILKPRFVCETVRRRLNPTTLISLARKFKGGWKEGLVCRWREIGERLGAVASVLKSSFNPVWNLWTGSNLLPSEHTRLAVSVAGREKDWEAGGEEAANTFFCLCVSHHADFCCFHSCWCSFPRAALLPPFPEAVVSLVLTFDSHVGGEPGCTEAAVNLAVAWTKHVVEWKSPGA